MVHHAEGRQFYDDGYDDTTESEALNDGINLSCSSFCGREQELQELRSAYTKCLATPSSSSDEITGSGQVVMISGRSGSGKSALVNRFIQLLEKESENGKGSPFFYMSGRFDELSRDRYSGVLDALGGLGSSLRGTKDSEKEMEKLRESVENSLGNEVKNLVTAVPSLSGVVSGRAQLETVGMSIESAQNRLRYLFQSLINAICCSDNRPVVLFLDDLQWIDSGSLDLLTHILRDRSLGNFMFIGAYRSTDVSCDHSLALALDESQKEGNEVVSLELPNLTLEEVEKLVSTALYMENDDDVGTLTRAVYNKTRGNAFFTRQALEELHRKNVLFYSRISFRWEWNEDGLEQLEVCLSSDVLQSIVDKINDLPATLKTTLVVASYTRSVFEKSLLQDLLEACDRSLGEDSLDKILELAVVEGLLMNDVGSTVYRFRHDKFKEATRSLVPPGQEQCKLKLAIGHRLGEIALRASAGEVEEWMLMLAAEYLRSVSTKCEDPAFLAELYLECGERASLVADFLPAMEYFELGQKALQKITGSWESHYNIALRLYRGLSDVKLGLGSLDDGEDFMNTVLERAKCFEDKIPTFLSWARALSRQDRQVEAFEVCLNALASAGFPHDLFRGMMDQRAVKRYLHDHSDEEILSLPVLTDKSVLCTLALCREAAVRAITVGNQPVWLRLSLRQIQLTIKHGLSGFSPSAFASYGLYLNAMGDSEGSARIARLVRAMTTRIEDKQKEGFALYTVTVFLEDWQSSLSFLVESLRAAHKSAMRAGDLETGFYCLCAINVFAYESGTPLGKLEKGSRTMLSQMKRYQEEQVLHLLVEIRFPMLALTGRLRKPIDFEGFLKPDGFTTNRSARLAILHHCIGRLEVAVFFRRFDIANEVALMTPEMHVEGCAFIVPQLFFWGLACSGLARETGNKSHYRQLLKLLKKMKRLHKLKCPKLLGKVRILEAEKATFETADLRKIGTAYDEAISTAMESKFTQDAALANESAGECFVERGDFEAGAKYFRQAFKLYQQWGATAKCKELSRRRSDFIGGNPSLSNSTASQ